MIFDKSSKNIHGRKDFFFSLTNDAGRIAYCHTKIVKLDIYLKPYTNINSKWNNDLNWKLNTFKKSWKKTEQKGFTTLHLPMIYVYACASVCVCVCVCVCKTPKSHINKRKNRKFEAHEKNVYIKRHNQ